MTWDRTHGSPFSGTFRYVLVLPLSCNPTRLTVLEQTNYPSLKELNFEFPPRVFPYAIRRLKKRYPNLRDCLKELKFQEVTQFFHHDFSFADGVLAGDHDYFEP